MARSQKSHGFTAIRVEGGILPPEFLRDIAALDAPYQNGADYGLTKSLTLKDELARYWRIAGDLYSRYSARYSYPVPGASQVGIGDWLVPFLCTVLGYDDLAKTKSVARGERVFRLSHRACSGAVPVLLVTREVDLDRSDPCFGHEGRRQSPHGLIQEFLNAEDACLWGIVSNGSRLRILRDNPSLTRPSYIEIDLDLIFAEELYSDFAALWLAAHATRFMPLEDTPSRCIIEVWRAEAHKTGERALENLRDGVTEALRQLGNGFVQHPENDSLRTALSDGDLSPEQYFQQLLRLVYRLLFLFTAEERDLLHVRDATDAQRAVFADGYSLSRLRERARLRRHYDRHGDLWLGLQVTFRALMEGAPALGLPALGGLFRMGQCHDLDGAAITNERLLQSVHNLGFFRSDHTLARVNYRDMDAEELGSVYESLLELQPAVDVNTTPWTFSFIGDGNDETTKGSQRKLTGSYYTPSVLVNELIKSALEPVLAQAIVDRPENPREAILDLNVLDPACGSGHFLLAAARRMAVEIVRVESGTYTSDETARRHAIREVVQRCIYGVDRNPLAVELCKTALWIETVEPGKPLTFLDSHIVLGDSLVGIIDPKVMANGIPGEAYKPLTGDDKAMCKDFRKRNRQMDTSVQGRLFDRDGVFEAAMTTVDLDAMPEDTLDDIERKRNAWEASQSDYTRVSEELYANLFVGAYFAQKTRETYDTTPVTEDLNRLNKGIPQRPGVEAAVKKLARQHSFFHWHIVFAKIMQDGGFDALLGNPPWERIKLQQKEFFASRSPKIANAPNKAIRDQLIKQLDQDDVLPAEKALFQAFESAKREADAASQYARTGGRFPLAGIGDLNTYALFTEMFLQLVNPRGRAGLIVPTGIATDNSTKALFDEAVAEKKLVSLFDFENREKVFPGIDSRIKFCLLTLTGAVYPSERPEFAFFLHRAEQLKEDERRFTLSAEDFALFNPNTRTCPIFRTHRDMEIARKMYRRAGVFWREARDGLLEVNPWGVKFSRMFDMSNDSDIFRTRQQLEDAGWQLEGNMFLRDGECCLPLYEAKLFHQYDHRFATFEGVTDKDIRNGNARPMTQVEKADVHGVALPRYWVPETEVEKRLDTGASSTQLITEQNRTEQNRTEQNRTEQNRYWIHSQSWFTTCSAEHHRRYQRENGDLRYDSTLRFGSLGNNNHSCSVVFRGISRGTDQRTSIYVAIRATAVSNSAPLLNISGAGWLQCLRGITTATNERTLISDNIPPSAVGNSAPVMDYGKAQAISSALVLANMNSIPLDWAARLSVGGVNMNFFIVKQLPVLPPEAYMEEVSEGLTFVELIIPRVLELTYTAYDLEGFAKDLGYHGPPFNWDDQRRHLLQSELDAIYIHMYHLERSDLEWILDTPPPGSSFPSLKQKEIKEFGEYRTQRYILSAYDQLERGENPDLANMTTELR